MRIVMKRQAKKKPYPTGYIHVPNLDGSYTRIPAVLYEKIAHCLNEELSLYLLDSDSIIRNLARVTYTYRLSRGILHEK